MCFVHFKRLTSAIALILLFAAQVAVSAQERPVYKLAVQDKVRITIYQFPSWPGPIENGEFSVGITGHLSLPLVGDVPAAGFQATEIAQAIASRLQSKASLVQSPDVTVEVVQLRPFYILGDVEKPGEYPFAPGMMVVNAVSVAGGIYRPADLSARFQRDAITTQGELNVLLTQERELIARRARLQAELNGDPKISYPAEFSKGGNPTNLLKLTAQEQMIFLTRREAMSKEVAALENNIALMKREVEVRNAQIGAVKQEQDLMARELNNVRDLVQRGLAASPRQLAADRDVVELKRTQLDLETAVLKAQQSISDAEQKILTLRNKQRSEVTEEFQKTESKLDEVRSQIATAHALMDEANILGPRELANRVGAPMQPIYTIIRRDRDVTREITVSDTTLIEPADVIKVKARRQAIQPDVQAKLN